MGNVYSAQNVASYFIYELNEMHTFINAISLQHLLAEVEEKWMEVFGHSAYSEKVHSIESTGYVVKEVFDAYQISEKNHISLPAKEWHLIYGEFQLVHRTYGIPSYTEKEELIVKSIIKQYREETLKKVS